MKLKLTDLKKTIKEKYTKALASSKQQKGSSCCSEKISCCSESILLDQEKIDSSQRELIIPSFGCIYDLPSKASLKEAEVVVDFGSGSGFDLIRAAQLVGENGRVIGIDMTPEMVKQAEENIRKLHLHNVEIKLGDIENVPLEDNSVDVVISNCVINLSTNKQKVFDEAFRILKVNGRLVDGDTIIENDLPESLKSNSDAWCSCISGTLTKDGYIELLKTAGFTNISVEVSDKSSFEWDGKDISLLHGIIRGTKK